MVLVWEGWFTLAVIGVVLVLLIRDIAAPDVAMVSAAVVLGIAGILSPEQVFQGFTNPGVITIGALFIVAAAIQETGALDLIGNHLLGKAKTEHGVLLRTGLTVMPLSAFLNNTPVVAMLMPVLTRWGRKNGVSPSRLLIPLSYFAILGGLCSLIGTSTIIVVNGLMGEQRIRLLDMAQESGGEMAAVLSRTGEALHSLGMFEVTVLGIPFCLIGLVYLLTVGKRLMPARKDVLDIYGESSRDYLIDLQLKTQCRLVGQSVKEAGLRQLPGLFLVEIVRDSKIISPVRPDEVLEAGDLLTFTGVVSTIMDLERIPGMVPVADDTYEEEAAKRREQSLCEAVISATSPLIGMNVRDSNFRALYNAAIIAVHRGGHRLSGRVGDIVLQNGDTLLLQADPHFLQAHRNNRDFYLVGGVAESRSVRNDRLVLAVVLIAGLILAMSTRIVAIPLAASLCAALMIATQCISPAVAREAIDWRTLLTIGGAIAVGKAMDQTGAAGAIAALLVDHTKAFGPYVLLAIIYLVTSLLTECITTKGSAVLMFEIAVAMSMELDLSPRPFVLAVIFAAAASFVTPLGYQTNLMVYGPGGYKYSDYVRVGLPLNIMLVLTAVLLIPLIWPFQF